MENKKPIITVKELEEFTGIDYSKIDPKYTDDFIKKIITEAEEKVRNLLKK